MLKRWITFTWLRPLLCGLVLITFIGQAAAKKGPEVVYDKVSDRLSVKAEKTSLKGLLARIALLSGVEFLMDLAAEQPISINIENMTIEAGLKKIVKSNSLDYAMVYQKKEGQLPSAEPLLISMKIVPKGMGMGPNSKLLPVENVNGEAVIRSFSRRPPRAGETPPSIFSYAEERWQARLSEMSEEKRKQIEAEMLERQKKQAK